MHCEKQWIRRPTIGLTDRGEPLVAVSDDHIEHVTGTVRATRKLRDGLRLTCAAGRPSPSGPSAWPGPSRLPSCAEIRRRALVLLLALLLGRPGIAPAWKIGGVTPSVASMDME